MSEQNRFQKTFKPAVMFEIVIRQSDLIIGLRQHPSVCTGGIPLSGYRPTNPVLNR